MSSAFTILQPSKLPCKTCTNSTIDSIYAYISEDEDGDEGVCGAFVGDQWMPMIAADKTRLDQLRPYAVQLQKVGGRKVKLVQFTERKNLEEEMKQ